MRRHLGWNRRECCILSETGLTSIVEDQIWPRAFLCCSSKCILHSLQIRRVLCATASRERQIEWSCECLLRLICTVGQEQEKWWSCGCLLWLICTVGQEQEKWWSCGCLFIIDMHCGTGTREVVKLRVFIKIWYALWDRNKRSGEVVGVCLELICTVVQEQEKWWSCECLLRFDMHSGTGTREVVKLWVFV